MLTLIKEIRKTKLDYLDNNLYNFEICVDCDDYKYKTFSGYQVNYSDLQKVCRIIGVNNWDDLLFAEVRLILDKNNNQIIQKIGHIKKPLWLDTNEMDKRRTFN
jgi:hypothetical protein